MFFFKDSIHKKKKGFYSVYLLVSQPGILLKIVGNYRKELWIPQRGGKSLAKTHTFQHEGHAAVLSSLLPCSVPHSKGTVESTLNAW